MATKRASPAKKSAARKPAKKSAATKTRTREQSKEATKARIVTAALDLFERQGFERTTTKEIARRARVAEGTVFNYFETKEDIALHFFELEVEHAIATVRSNEELRSAPLEERLFALLEAQFEYLAPYESFIGAAFLRALRPASKLGFSVDAMALRGRYLAFVQELIDDALPIRHRAWHVSMFGPHAFWIFYVGVLLFWLGDSSPGKEATLAFVDRALRAGAAILRSESDDA
jgi:AcrR family transcriptional regulator